MVTDTAPPITTELLAFRPDLSVTTATHRDGAVELATSRGTTTLTTLTPGLQAATLRLGEGPVSTEELMATCRAVEGELTAMQVPLLLSRFERSGMLSRAVYVGDDALLTMIPSGWVPTHKVDPIEPDTLVKLSRFARISAEDGALRAQNPRSHVYVVLGSGAGELLSCLAEWTTTATLAAPTLAADTVRDALGLLHTAGLLTFGGPAKDPESDEQHAAQWSSIDLAVHARSRSPHLGDSYGGSYPFRDRFPALAGSPPPCDGHAIELPRPDLARLRDTDVPFAEVVETRRSIRTHDDAHPLTVGALGELLYRVARTRRTNQVEGSEIVDRPYPAGGSLHELEIYPVVTNVAGLEHGLWHYRGEDHHLERLDAPEEGIAGLLAMAQSSANMSAPPQVLLIITARFGRVTWKYTEMAYALMLKHVGVLYQSLYLTATAMGLAGCGLGGGDAQLFASTSGRDYLTEGSVGEFVLGSPGA